MARSSGRRDSDAREERTRAIRQFGRSSSAFLRAAHVRCQACQPWWGHVGELCSQTVLCVSIAAVRESTRPRGGALCPGSRPDGTGGATSGA
jgi:hypothetical protein